MKRTTLILLGLLFFLAIGSAFFVNQTINEWKKTTSIGKSGLSTNSYFESTQQIDQIVLWSDSTLNDKFVNLNKIELFLKIIKEELDGTYMTAPDFVTLSLECESNKYSLTASNSNEYKYVFKPNNQVTIDNFSIQIDTNPVIGFKIAPTIGLYDIYNQESVLKIIEGLKKGSYFKFKGFSESNVFSLNKFNSSLNTLCKR